MNGLQTENVFTKTEDVRIQIYQYLKENHIAQVRLAKATGLSGTMISEVLRGHRKLTAENLAKINKDLGTHFTEIGGPTLQMGATG